MHTANMTSVSTRTGHDPGNIAKPIRAATCAIALMASPVSETKHSKRRPPLPIVAMVAHMLALSTRQGSALACCPQLPDRLASVGRRLIGQGDLAHGAAEFVKREVLAHFPGVEAGPRHEGDLVEQEIAGGADFALVVEARAQHPRPGECAPVAELREFEHDH